MSQQEQVKDTSNTPQANASSVSPPTPEADFSVVTQSLRKVSWIATQTIVFLNQLFSSLSSFWNKYKQLIVTTFLIVLTLILLRIVLAFAIAIIDAFNDIPLLAPTLQLIGIGYSVWFCYRYLLKPSTRNQLRQQTQQFFSQPKADAIDKGEGEQLSKRGIVPRSAFNESVKPDKDSEEQEITATNNTQQFSALAESDVTSTRESKQLYKPGEIVPISGQYQLINPDGASEGREVTSTKGEHFPPTPESGMHYQLADATVHKSDQESPNQPDENNTVNISSEQLYKPGEIVPTSGQYQLINPDGASEGREVTSTKGEHFPPTPESGMHYQLVDRTQHKHN